MINNKITFKLTAAFILIAILSTLTLAGVFLTVAYVMQCSILGLPETHHQAEDYLLLGTVLSCLIATFLGIVYSQRFTKPLKIMHNAASEMTQGNYGIRTAIRQNDEIGELSNSLDKLASELEYTIDQLFQEKDKLNDIISSMSDGIVAFDTEMKLLNYNETLMTLLGYSNIFSFKENIIQDLQSRKLLDIFSQVIQNEDVSSTVAEWFDKTLALTISPIKDTRNHISGVVALVHDISESHKYEQMRKDFIANVSHEFRTPLTLIKGSIEAIIDSTVYQEDEVKSYNLRILNETRSLERLVSDLLDLSQLQSGKMSLNLDELDLASMVEDVFKGMQIIALPKDIQLSLSTKMLPPIMGDYDRIRQLLIILIDNAIKHSPDGTHINVLLYASDLVYIQITDQGKGIPADEIPFIWDRFYKVDKSADNLPGSTGLGLAIAKHIVELHHGIINIHSQLNIGTTVIIGFAIKS